jgi:hypothetical protein
MVPDTTSPWEQLGTIAQGAPPGAHLFAVVSVVSLPDGSYRMYYTGNYDSTSPGTPSYYASNPFPWGPILSARSTDNGLT